jgi:polar amino acid transport system substrate-binding protein
VDVLVIDRSIFQWYRQQLSGKANTEQYIDTHFIFPDTLNFKVAFRNQHIRNEFNMGLAQLRESGVYEAIYARYLNEL